MRNDDTKCPDFLNSEREYFPPLMLLQATCQGSFLSIIFPSLIITFRSIFTILCASDILTHFVIILWRTWFKPKGLYLTLEYESEGRQEYFGFGICKHS